MIITRMATIMNSSALDSVVVVAVHIAGEASDHCGIDDRKPQLS